jgi:UDP-N-acetylglucosamine:LPS N-acetylglucosamine transferase
MKQRVVDEPLPASGTILIAGGGTAGHVLPGLAVAEELVSRGHPREGIHFVGSVRGPESELVGAAGFRITLLPGRGIQRRISAQNIRSVWDLARGIGIAVLLVGRTRPSVVLVLGGYASLGCALAAIVWRAPMVVADQNARAGAVNRLAAPFARACAAPFGSTDLPRKVVSGNPVRPEIRRRAQESDPAAAREALGLPLHGMLVAVFAGSLGARRINAAVWEALRGEWSTRSDLVVHHVIGSRDWDDRPSVDHRGGSLDREGPRYNPVRYEDRMALLLDAADVVVCRAGGTTVAELTVMGTPSILVPLPIATRDHQSANAAELTAVGAAVAVPDEEFDSHRLALEVGRLLEDRRRLDSMAAAGRAMGRPDAAGRIADLLEQHAR